MLIAEQMMRNKGVITDRHRESVDGMWEEERGFGVPVQEKEERHEDFASLEDQERRLARHVPE
jgi:hypothetical protein